MARRGYPPEFRRRAVELVEGGRKVAGVAADLGISEQTFYTWRRQARIDAGLEAGLSKSEQAELAAAKRRIRELETELIMAPIYQHDRWIMESQNFSETLPSRTLNYWRYRIVWAFYWRAILTSSKRLLRVLPNFFAGREDSKFDSFLQILKERFITRRAGARQG